MKKTIFFILFIIFLLLLFEGYIFNFLGFNKYKIMGKGKANPEKLTSFFLKHNNRINKKYVNYLASIYIKEGTSENVNSDVAFCQMCLETNFLRFGGQVKVYQNNFAGLGATDNGAAGASFKTHQEGVRAQIQHLKAYASKSKLKNRIIDPRFNYVERASAQYVSELGNGKWASDPDYGAKIIKLINQL